MGLYYKLNNGEEIEIRIKDIENFTKELQVLLFNGSTVLTYPINGIFSLNELLEDIEDQYNDLLIENQNFEYSCWCD